MNNETAAQRVGLGAAAGLVGTFLIQGLLAASEKWAPETLPPIKQNPGNFMVEKVEGRLPDKLRKNIPEPLEKAAAGSLAFGYGTTFGAIYGASRPEVKSVLLEGSALGLVTWAAGYLGWLPATRLMPPVVKQEPQQIVAPIISHVLFGIVTAGLYRLVGRRK